MTITMLESDSPVFPQLSDQQCQVIGRNGIETSAAKGRKEMAPDRVAVALLRAGAKIMHWPLKPLGADVSEPQPSIWCDALSVMPASQQLVAECASGGDTAINRPPPLLAGGILEADLEDARRRR
jgi:hypothetical protein